MIALRSNQSYLKIWPLIVSAKNSSLTKKSSYTLLVVSALALIVPPHPHGFRGVIESAFAEQDLIPTFAYESQVQSVIKEHIESGLAHAIFTPSVVAANIRRGRMTLVPKFRS